MEEKHIYFLNYILQENVYNYLFNLFLELKQMTGLAVTLKFPLPGLEDIDE